MKPQLSAAQLQDLTARTGAKVEKPASAPAAALDVTPVVEALDRVAEAFSQAQRGSAEQAPITVTLDASAIADAIQRQPAAEPVVVKVPGGVDAAAITAAVAKGVAEAMAKAQQPRTWSFKVKRDHDGFLDSIVATPT